MSVENRLSKSQQATLSQLRNQLSAVVTAFRHDGFALVGLSIVTTFILLAVFGPVIAPYDPTRTFPGASLQPPSVAHPFGTNHLGQDILSQWIYGTRVSVMVGLVAGFTVMVIGSVVGLVAGYYKGRIDIGIMRVVDTLYGIPAIPLVLVLTLFFEASVWNILFAFALVLWRTMARIIRSETLSMSERPFVKAARASGASDPRIIFLHIAPNLLPLIMIQTTLDIGYAIVLEAGVSFLGLGASEMISWGTMLQMTFVTGAIREAWWWVLPPGLGITALVLSFFYISRAIEEVTNPELKGGQ